jgi:hypothetical protein
MIFITGNVTRFNEEEAHNEAPEEVNYDTSNDTGNDELPPPSQIPAHKDPLLHVLQNGDPNDQPYKQNQIVLIE